MPPKSDWEKYKKPDEDAKDDDKIVALDEGDIQILKTYGQGPYAGSLKKIESEIKDVQTRINEKMGIKESDTGLAPRNLWDLAADKQRMSEEKVLQVARCTKIIRVEDEQAARREAAQNARAAAGGSAGGAAIAGALGAGAGATEQQNPFRGPDDRPSADEEDKYVINIKQIAKFVVGLGERVAPTDIEEGMRVGVDRNRYQIQIPLPPKIDPSVTMMQVEEKPDVTYSDVGGCKEQIEKLREVVETPLLNVSTRAGEDAGDSSGLGLLTARQHFPLPLTRTSRSPNDLSTSASTRPKESCSLVLLVLERRCALEP